MSTEHEQTTPGRFRRNRHDGHRAGTGTERQFPSDEQLQTLIRMRVPAAVGMGW